MRLVLGFHRSSMGKILGLVWLLALLPTLLHCFHPVHNGLHRQGVVFVLAFRLGFLSFQHQFRQIQTYVSLIYLDLVR